jgi:hypothetical protein
MTNISHGLYLVVGLYLLVDRRITHDPRLLALDHKSLSVNTCSLRITSEPIPPLPVARCQHTLQLLVTASLVAGLVASLVGRL